MKGEYACLVWSALVTALQRYKDKREFTVNWKGANSKHCTGCIHFILGQAMTAERGVEV
jgi:hypothetical protein